MCDVSSVLLCFEGGYFGVIQQCGFFAKKWDNPDRFFSGSPELHYVSFVPYWLFQLWNILELVPCLLGMRENTVKMFQNHVNIGVTCAYYLTSTDCMVFIYDDIWFNACDYVFSMVTFNICSGLYIKLQEIYYSELKWKSIGGILIRNASNDFLEGNIGFFLFCLK